MKIQTYKYMLWFSKFSVLAMLLIAALFAALQFSVRGQFPDPDGFYHAKASQLLLQGDLSNSFPWMAYTTWNVAYADQHYLYHVLLVPFNSIQTLQISIIVFAVLFCALFLLLLRQLNVKWHFFWMTILLLGSVDFLFRINLIKANTISLALLCVIILLVLWWKERNRVLPAVLMTVTSFIFVWTYGGFIFVPALLGLYVIAIAITEKKFDYVPFMASSIGIVLGLLLHPHGTHLLQLLYDQIFHTGLGAGSVIPAGGEWLPYNLDWFLKTDIPVLGVWVISMIVFGVSIKNKTVTWLPVWLQATALFLLALALWHRRFIEYFVPFAVLASAVTLAPYIAQLRWKECKASICDHWQISVVLLFITAVLVASFAYNVQLVHRALVEGQRGDVYKRAAQVIAGNSEPGDIVFNTQWDQFPQLFYWNSKNYYVVGLDPTFMYLQDSALYWQWRSIADDDPSRWQSVSAVHGLVYRDFKSKFVFIENNRNTNLLNYILSEDMAHTYFDPVYEDGEITIFMVK